MSEFMKLRLCRFPVHRITFGPRTQLQDNVLTINRDELQSLILADPRLAGVTIDAAHPGESCRVVNVQDVLQPRAKVAGVGTVFPGFLPGKGVPGSGTTHCLTGMAIASCGEISAKSSAEGPASVTGPRDRFIEMSGPGAISPFSGTANLVLAYQPAPEVSPLEFEAAMRLGSIKAADYAARASRGCTPAEDEVLDLAPAPGLPRVVYIVQIHNDGFLRATFLYGEETVGATQPTLLHPSEMADGVLVNGSLSHAAVSTYAFQDNQVVRELWRLHGKEVDFAGVIMTTRHHFTDTDKEQRQTFTAKLAKQLGAVGAVLSQEGGGNSIVDQMLCCKACEEMGIKTAVVTYEMGGRAGTDFPLIYHVPEAVAIASTSNREQPLEIPPMERALGGTHFLYPRLPATGPFSTYTSEMAFAIDLSGFWRLRAYDY